MLTMPICARIAPLVLLLGCGSGKDSDPVTTPVPTETTVSTLPEDCTDGADNDADGLLDCEDDDCAADPACLEQDCADGVDNDGDGRQDCADEDCWGNGAR